MAPTRRDPTRSSGSFLTLQDQPIQHPGGTRDQMEYLDDDQDQQVASSSSWFMACDVSCCTSMQKVTHHHHHHHHDDQQQHQQQQEQIVAWLMALIGVGYLLPFTALTQPVTYWKLLFPTFTIQFELLSTFIYTRITCLALLVALCSSAKVNFTRRIVGGFGCQLVMLLVLPWSSQLPTAQANLILVLFCTLLAGSGTALIDSVVIAVVSQFPVRVQEAYQIGVGFSALVTCLLSNTTKWLFSVDQIVASTCAFFLLNAWVTVGCIAAYAAMLRLPITRRYLFHEFASEPPLREIQCNANSNTNQLQSRRHERVHLLSSPINNDGTLPTGLSATRPNYESIQPVDLDYESRISCSSSSSSSSSASSSTACTESSAASVSPSPSPIKSTTATSLALTQNYSRPRPTKSCVLRKVVWLQLQISLVFIVSLSLWPPLLTVLPSFQHPELQANGWYSLILLTLFSLCDSTSRFLVKLRVGLVTPHNVHWLVLGRVALIPTFVGIANHWWLSQDAIVFALVVLLGTSNGFLSALLVLFVCDRLDDDEQILAGGFTSVALNVGFVGGASLGLLLQRFVAVAS